MSFLSNTTKFNRIFFIAATTTLGVLTFSTSGDAANRQAAGLSEKVQPDGILELPGTNWWDAAKNNPVIHLIVDKAMQRVRVYADGTLISQSNVSTGKTGYETPGGIFSILSKNRIHHSNIYSRAPMPFMQRLTWSGIALHKSNSVPSYPASHGCIRMPGTFAGQLFEFTRTGAQVIITKRDVRPERFSSRDLFSIGNGTLLEAGNLRPSMELVSTIGPIPSGAASKPLRVLITRNSGRQKVMEIQAILNELQYSAGDEDGWMGPQTGKAIGVFQKDYRHRVTGSLTDELLAQLYRATGRGAPKNGHIYVRRNHKPLFDTAVVLADEQVPLGTHQFTAVYSAKNNTAQSTSQPYWLAVTIEPTGWPGSDKENSSDASSAADALQRFTLPQELKRRISAMITVGSTVVIADQGISRETGSGTDFIILTQ